MNSSFFSWRSLVTQKPIGRRNIVAHVAVVSLVIGLPMSSPSTSLGGNDPGAIDIRARGAKGDGKTKDTGGIQAAIDECARKGGGTVSFPAGTFLSGSLHLASNVRLHLDSGATLLASKDAADFDPYELLTFKNAADRET